MPIEYQNNEGDAPAPDLSEDVAEETVDIPASILQGKTVNPGDVVRLEVVTADDGSGTVTVKYATEEPMKGGIREAAEQFTMEA